MKFINLIVDFLLNTNKNESTKTENSKKVFLPCSELFGGLNKNESSKCLNYNYTSVDFNENKVIEL